MAGLRFLVDPLLGESYPYFPFFIGSLLCAGYRGWKSGALALGLGFLAADFLFLAPRGSLGPLGVKDWAGLVVLAGVGGFTLALVEALNRAKQRSEAHARQLAEEVAEHRQTQEALQQATAELERRVDRRTNQLSVTTSQLRQAESRLRRLAALVASSEDAIIGKDLGGLITDWNSGAEHLFGYSAEEVVGRHVSILTTSDWHAQVAEYTERFQRGENVLPFETVRRTKDGREIPISVRISPIRENGRLIGLASINRDLRPTRGLEEQLRQAQKMEAIGQLAGGVAHDFNNLLTIISGYCELLLRRPGDDSARRLLKEIHGASERASALTRQLLAFSRKQVLAFKEVNLNDTVAQAERMLRRLIGEDVQLNTELAADLEDVRADAGQIEQVLMNLAVNARDAMPTGGRITIETANVDPGETYRAEHLEGSPGRFVRLTVRDSGCGMDEKTRARIFEPFFTTKETGKGTGLGLAVVHGIIKQSGGHIAVQSEPGEGTTFRLYLPAIGRRQGVKPSADKVEPAPTGSETILLAEDEEMVRRLTRTVLEGSGYRVLEACDGREALRLAERHSGPIDLLVTDVVMPEMGGGLLSERLRAARPGVKVLFLSGYTDDAVVRHGVQEEERAFLQKPFTPAALAGKVREVLDR